MSRKLGEPENDGKYEGKTWDEVEHRCPKRSRAILNTSIPKYLRKKAVKKRINQNNPSIQFQLQA